MIRNSSCSDKRYDHDPILSDRIMIEEMEVSPALVAPADGSLRGRVPKARSL
jgi:hypothetical protein